MHLARAIENPHTTDEERWQVNVQGTLAVVQAAVDARIQKLIHASSLSVFDGYDLRLGTPGREDLEPKHGSFYGFTKHVAEIIVKQCAEQHGLRSVTLRLVAVVPDDRDLPEDLRWMLNPIIRTSGRDVAQAFQLALETPLDAPYEVFHISSGHPNRYWPHDKATRVLGYQPVDRFDAPRWVNPWTKVRRAAARDSG
jgi:nucleoside-diphosphate-sugar epimerase